MISFRHMCMILASNTTEMTESLPPCALADKTLCFYSLFLDCRNSVAKHGDRECFGIRPIVKIHEEKKVRALLPLQIRILASGPLAPLLNHTRTHSESEPKGLYSEKPHAVVLCASV